MRQQLIRAGQPVPPELEDKPIMLGLVLYYDAFFDLAGSRQIGFSIGTIPWLAVRQYAMYNGFDSFQTYFLHNIVPEMDAIYLRMQRAKSNKPKAK